ncbi:tRNA (uracil-5-)-methyltransferase Gid [Spiroplasma sp. TIUS-1]|uniref:methylenetetrahydrofolate--tRNA-(uracil(54)- C(5))-methyltransferase (FADH(2)-oxidizing) TrmFO n=1 Tax=Spiroplasma sp. TIUS-1 TaxID=216963 RepID=UPI0013979A02|nr:methylenetetrahydrofolate--tRNA-(uracil(54)-C(5))-methyltransferase (FADH(2)-oxidizing) TrmFO [Spiroplasma sp. TIUS-1]QHX35844.1 tRNA (uracil-5-)-methyltransferase Gid [Spiroplasma sp. TIUS-1]
MKKYVNIIGAGLAGCEAAYQLSKRKIYVNLYEVKGIKRNPVQTMDTFAELVCSNTLRSTEPANAVGTLKLEMQKFDSLILKAAYSAQLPAGGSLAVDREIFSGFIDNEIRNNEYINVISEDVGDIDPNQITIVASGPLTTPKLQTGIQKLVGSDYFYFFDAVAPIVKLDSLDMNKLYWKNRYDKGETKDYLNAPMTKHEYEKFLEELLNSEKAEMHLKDEESLRVFEGCMPVEVMASRGKETLLYGPLKPVGLYRSKEDKELHAVVQLRQDNAAKDLFNLVGFQTNLKWGEQKRVFRMIPGLENAEFIRYGVMHKNNFINSPTLLNKHMQMKSNPNIFFAGQITGVEGYVESTSSGIIAAVNVARKIEEKELIEWPDTTVMGALINYICITSPENFQPMKANWQIVNTEGLNKKMKKILKKEQYSIKALKDIEEFINKYKI